MSSPAKLLLLVLAAWAVGAGAAEKNAKSGRNPFYGAIAYHAPTKSVGWATDRKTSREARVEALKHCGHEHCVIVGTVTRGCIALAAGAKATAVQNGVTQQEAEAKALSKCGAGCEVAVWTCTR